MASTPTLKSPGVSWTATVKFLWFLLGDLRGTFGLFLALILILQLHEFIPPLIVGKVVDTLSGSNPEAQLAQITVLILILATAHLLAAWVRVPLRMRFKQMMKQLVYKVRVQGFQNLVDFSLTWHEQESAGNKVQKLQNGTNALDKLGNSITSGGYGVTAVAVSLLATILIFAATNLLIFILCIAYLALFAFFHKLFARKIQRLLIERNKKLENASGNFYEGLNNLLAIKSLGAGKSFSQKIDSSESITRDFEFAVIKARSTRAVFFNTTIGIALGIFMVLLVWQYLSGMVSLGNILIFYTYFDRLLGNAWQLMDLVDEMSEIKEGLHGMRALFPEEKGTLQQEKFPIVWDKIEAKHLEYKYQSNNEIALNDINLVIKRGETVGIAGSSGSGKSTFVKLLLGLYAPSSGGLQIGGVGVNNISHEELGHHTSIVLQESELFNMSLQDNITLLTELEPARLAAAIEISQLSELVANLPDGVATVVGEKGYRLSGGERQRLGIARAIYKDSEIIILDEATSNLDTQTEAAIQSAFAKYLQGKTLIIIAHRLSTLRDVDKIFVFSDGEIVQQGNYTELTKVPGRFKELYDAQHTLLKQPVESA